MITEDAIHKLKLIMIQNLLSLNNTRLNNDFKNEYMINIGTPLSQHKRVFLSICQIQSE